jgi:hypothetical protein
MSACVAAELRPKAGAKLVRARPRCSARRTHPVQHRLPAKDVAFPGLRPMFMAKAV